MAVEWGQGYETPSVSELQDFLLANRIPTGHVNQVWPNLYIGNEVAARDKPLLYHMGITHIVNAASRPPHVNTGPRFYRDMNIDYYGVEADDSMDFIIAPYFYSTARFIRAALGRGGKVFVHCLMGVSRSATLVLAFLMICEDLTLRESLPQPPETSAPTPASSTSYATWTSAPTPASSTSYATWTSAPTPASSTSYATWTSAPTPASSTSYATWTSAPTPASSTSTETSAPTPASSTSYATWTSACSAIATQARPSSPSRSAETAQSIWTEVEINMFSHY